MEEEILKIAEGFQDECHAMVEKIKANTSAAYQDATNIWMFKKLAELQLEIDRLKKKQKSSVVRGL